MDYTRKIRLGRMRVRPINILSEEFTFGQRIALGMAVQCDTRFAIMAETMRVLHNINIGIKDIERAFDYFCDILEKLNQWCEREKLLHYEPTPEEKQAGIKELGSILKEFGQVDAIATRMHISHDDAMKLPYSTVFMMLRKDLEQSKFERRLQKVYERKWKNS